MKNPILVAAQGQDLEDFLQHIAWTDLILPEIRRQKEILASRLVASVLNAGQPGGESREQIAGKMLGLDWLVSFISSALKKGGEAKAILAEHNISLQPLN